MKKFLVTLRTGNRVQRFYALAHTAAASYDLVAADQGDDVFGITVTPVSA